MAAFIRHLINFDFDNTIVDGHFHNRLKILQITPGSATPADINDLLEKHKILNQEELLKTMRALLKKGHHIAITTWGEYPEVIPPTLRKLGLTEAEIAEIHIESGFPTSLTQGKSEHITRAKRHFGITDNRHVWLIDDDEKNIAQAKKEGQIGIHVKNPRTNKDYLELIQTFLNQRRVKIASLDSLEGKRLYELRRKLQVQGNKPTAPRKDDETPLRRFLAKDQEVVQIEKSKKNVVNTEKSKKNVVNDVDMTEATKIEPAKMLISKKIDLPFLFFGVVLGTLFWCLSMPLVAVGSLSAVLLIEATRHLVSSRLHVSIHSSSKDPSKSLEENNVANDIETTPKGMVPYFKQPKAIVLDEQKLHSMHPRKVCSNRP
jgi:hypothetical protein